jgi:hypothetical protein
VRILTCIVAIAAAAAWSAAPVMATSDAAPLADWFADHSEPPDTYAQDPNSLLATAPPAGLDTESGRHSLRRDPEWLARVDLGQHVRVSGNQERREIRAKTADKKFWALASAHVALLVADTAISLALTRRCPQCKENDPYTAPIINAGPMTAYPATIAFGVGTVSLSWWMKREHTSFRWWIIPAAIAAGNAWCVASNLRYWSDAGAR